MLKFDKISFLLIIISIFTISEASWSQSQDSLLQKINDIDIAIDTPPDSVENLYLNTVSFQSFYDLLSPVGEWIQISKDEIDEEMTNGKGEGYSSEIADDEVVFIWRPGGIEANWRPYTDGRWVYTSRGWVWAGNEVWGAAVYHYGRWWHSGKFGWVWMPGYVWAPAWVQWRVSDNHIGWAPLAPVARWRTEYGINEFNYKYKAGDNDWVFVNKSGFADNIDKGNIVSSGENGKLIQNSKSILNIRAENEAVVHAGPDVNEIENASGKLIAGRKLEFVKDRNKSIVGEKEIALYKVPLTKYKSMEEKINNEKIDKPQKFTRTERAKKIIKRRNHARLRIRKHR